MESVNEKLYSLNTEVQDMLIDCRKNSKLAKKVLSGVSGSADKAAVRNVIDSGWWETFLRYDSVVTDKFINAYLDAKGIEEAIVHLYPKNNKSLVRRIGMSRKSLNDSKELMSYKVYKGYDITYNLYGSGEYTVQFEGDDLVFNSEKEAKAFIDAHASN